MSKILLISDNQFINLLYVMNIEVYLNRKVSLVQSATDALFILKQETFDLIITLETVKGENAQQLIDAFLKFNDIKTPLLTAGSGKFNIQIILKNSAKILGITAKQMAALDVGNFYPVSLDALISLTRAPCHIYQNASSEKFLVRQDDPMEGIISELAINGVEQVFVSSKDRLLITNKISLTIIEKITGRLNNLEGAPVLKKIEALSDGYEFAAANLFSSDEIKQQMQEIATASAKVMGDVARDTSSLRSLLTLMLNNKNSYVFIHSMIVSYATHHMIKNATWGGEGQVEKVNFVLFFHDIFLVPIYIKYPELTSEPGLLDCHLLTDQEKEVVLEHAKLAAELVVTYKRCPMGADVLIKQHHGMKKGKNFTQIYLEDISPLAKIIMIAEMFVEEFMQASKDKSTPFNGKHVIAKLVSEFKSPSYAKMAATLANIPL